MLTNKEKAAIRSHYAACYHRIRFEKNGDVSAQQRPQGVWGILYRYEDAIRHLKAIGLR